MFKSKPKWPESYEARVKRLNRERAWRLWWDKTKTFLGATFVLLIVGAFLFALIYPRWLWATGQIDSHEYMRISGQTPHMILVE